MKVKALKKLLEEFKDDDELNIYVPHIKSIVSLDAPNKIFKKGKITIIPNKKDKTK
jgi:hypothetical protein